MLKDFNKRWVGVRSGFPLFSSSSGYNVYHTVYRTVPYQEGVSNKDTRIFMKCLVACLCLTLGGTKMMNPPHPSKGADSPRL